MNDDHDIGSGECLQPQLSARGVDVGSLALAHRGRDAKRFEDGDELLRARGGWFDELQFADAVHRDQVVPTERSLLSMAMVG